MGVPLRMGCHLRMGEPLRMGVPGLLNTCPLDSAHLRHLYRPGAWGVHAPPLAPQLGLATLWPTPHPYCQLKLPVWLWGRPVGAQVVGRPALWTRGPAPT